MKIRGMIAIVISLSLITGCSAVPRLDLKREGLVKADEGFAVSKAPLTATEVQWLKANRVQRSNVMGYELYKTMMEDNLKSTGEPKNLLFSPSSLAFALAMLQNGAGGETQEGILKVMGEDSDRLNEDYLALMNHLMTLSEKTDSKLILNLANSFWVEEDAKPKQGFVDALSRYYNAQTYTVDFTSHQTIELLNRWVEKQTKGMLKGTFTNLDPATVSILMNTVYFKGKWVSDFNPEFTRKMPFTEESGLQSQVDLMNQVSTFKYADNQVVQVAGLPYEGGMTLWIFLPREGMESLTGLSYDEMADLIDTASHKASKLDLALPKFEYKVENPLKEALKDAGMEAAFSINDADFTPMMDDAGGRLFVSEIFQNAKIIVDEEGTEAAAVTVIDIATTAMPEEFEPIKFHCDKPFMYVIQEDETGLILFIGAVEKP